MHTVWPAFVVAGVLSIAIVQGYSLYHRLRGENGAE